MKLPPAESPSPRRLQWIYALTGLLLLILSAIIGYGYYIAVRFQNHYLPLMISIEKIEQATSDCHRVAADVARSVVFPAVETVLKPLDENLHSFSQILAAEIKIPLAILPDRGLIDTEQIKRFIAAARKYRDTLSRYLQSEMRTDELKQGYEDSYLRFLRQTDVVEESIIKSMARGRSRFQKTMAVLIGVCIVLAVVVTLSFRRYERQNLENFFALADAHKELQEEIRERVRVENDLKESEEKFRSLFHYASDFIQLLDLKGRILLSNPAVVGRMGYTDEEMIGRPLADFMDDDSRSYFMEMFPTIFEHNGLRSECQLLTKDGRPIPVAYSATAVQNSAGDDHFVAILLKDITDRIAYERKIQTSIRFLNVANRYTEMRPLLKAFIEEIKRISGCSAVAVRIMDEEGNIPYAEAEGFSSEFCALESSLSIHSDKGMCVQVLQDKTDATLPYFTEHGSYFVNSTTRFLASASEEQKRCMRHTCHRFGFETLALVPIRWAGSNLGLIHVACPEKNRLTRESLEILEAASLQLGTAIQRVRVEQALQESHAELEVRVKQRTEQIARANEALLLEIEERKKTEKELLDYQRRLRSLSTELIQTQMQERRLIAREIHDGVGQALALVKIKLGGLQAALGAGKASETVKEIRDIVIQTIRDTRTLTFELSPPILYELGLQVALEWLAEFIRKQSGLRIIVKGDGADRNLNTQQRVFLFRAVRELLYNIVKHAGATKAKVRIDGRPEGIRVEVADNGSGFDTRVLAEKKKEPESGFGLFSIREQLQYYGGRLEINSGPGKGTRMIMSLPLKA